MRKKLIVAMLAVSMLPFSAKAISVGLELALLVDVSGSIDVNEYNLQRSGYVQAFQNAAIHNLIGQVSGGIAVTYIEWSGAGQQSVEVGWTHITDATSANNFATAVNGATRNYNGNTAPGSAINFAYPLFTGNGFEGNRLVIDVSGDGQENEGADTSDARDAALLAGIDRINGLAIGNATLASWYANNIQGGANAFTLQVDDFADFAAAINTKISAEISNTNPVPDGGPGMLLGMLLLGGMLRFARKN